MSKQAKTYTEEFKRETVRLATERGNIAQTARDLGVIDTSILYWKSSWKRRQRVPSPVKVLPETRKWPNCSAKIPASKRK